MFSIAPQDALWIKRKWIFDTSLACYLFWTHFSTVSESSSLNEVTFSFSTASSPDWSHKTVYATPRNINLLTHIGLDGATEDSIFEVQKEYKRITSQQRVSVCLKLQLDNWRAAPLGEVLKETSSWTDRIDTEWKGLSGDWQREVWYAEGMTSLSICSGL